MAKTKRYTTYYAALALVAMADAVGGGNRVKVKRSSISRLLGPVDVTRHVGMAYAVKMLDPDLAECGWTIVELDDQYAGLVRISDRDGWTVANATPEVKIFYDKQTSKDDAKKIIDGWIAKFETDLSADDCWE